MVQSGEGFPDRSSFHHWHRNRYESWVPVENRIPICEISIAILDLGDTSAIFRIVIFPVVEGIYVEILPVDADPLRCNQVVDVLNQPTVGLGITQIQ